MRTQFPFRLALPTEEGDEFVRWLDHRVGGDRRLRERLTALIQQWDHTVDQLGREPTAEEYAEQWSMPVATAYRTLAEFREVFPSEKSPSRLVSELWKGLGAPYLRGGLLGSLIGVRVRPVSTPGNTDSELPADENPVLRSMRLAYKQFRQTAEWPLVEEFQRALERAGDTIDLDELRDLVDPDLALIGRGPGARFYLTLGGIASTGDGRDDLDGFVRAVRLAYKRYLTELPSPRITRQDLIDEGGDPGLADRVRHLLDSEPYVTAGGSGQDGDWYRDVSPRVRYLREVDSVESYLRTVARRARSYPAAATRVVPAPGLNTIAIRDEELRRRCADLLTAPDNFDRAVREACVVLEDRVRAIARLPRELTGTKLMERAFSARDPLLRLSDIEAEQRGAMELFRGTIAYLRNPASHNLLAADIQDAAGAVSTVDFLLLRLAGVAMPAATAS